MTTGTRSSRQLKVASHLLGVTTATRTIERLRHQSDHSDASLGGRSDRK